MGVALNCTQSKSEQIDELKAEEGFWAVTDRACTELILEE